MAATNRDLRTRSLAPVPVEAVPGGDDIRVTPLKEVARLAVAEAERAAILAALHRVSGNRKAAARLLGISARALEYKLNRLGVRFGNRPPGSETRDAAG